MKHQLSAMNIRQTICVMNINNHKQTSLEAISSLLQHRSLDEANLNDI